MLKMVLPPSVGAARAKARAELLDSSLRAELSQTIEVEVARDYSDLADRARHDAHLVWLPPTICAKLEPHLRSVYKCIRRGHATYRSAVIVRRGEVQRVQDLIGKKAAWVDPLSVGGYLLAAAAFEAAGVDPVSEVGASFLGNYPEALLAVLDGHADVAAITVRDGSPAAIQESLTTYGGRKCAEELTVLLVTGESPNDAIGITRVLEPEREELLSKFVFENVGSRAEAALCLAFETEGFVRAEAREYSALRELLE